MSLLSDFLPKPYPGLTSAGSTLKWSLPQPLFSVEATDTTPSGATYPTFVLKTDRQAVNAGGSFIWQLQNDAAAFVSAAALQGQLTDITAGSEEGALLFIVYAGGAQKSLHIRGDVLAFMPNATSEGWSLGASSNRFAGAYLGNGTINADAIIDSGAFVIGTATNHSLGLKTNGTVRATLDASGRLGLLATPATNATLSLGGTHPSSATTIVGALAAQTIPQTATAVAASFQSAPATVAAAFTAAAVIGFDAADASKGAGSTITTQYGVRVGALTAGASNIGVSSQVATAANRWNLHISGTAPNYFAGSVGIGDAAPTALLDIKTASGTSTIGAIIRSESGTATGQLLQLKNLGATITLTAQDEGGNTTLSYARTGVLALGPSGASAAQTAGALVTIKGRLSQSLDTTYDRISSNWAFTHVIGDVDGASGLTVTAGKKFAGIAAYYGGGATVNGEGYSFFTSVPSPGLNTNLANALFVGYFASLSDSGIGTAKGGSFSATAGGTGMAVGVEAMAGQAAGAAASTAVSAVTLSSTSALDAAFRASGGVAGNQINYGVKIESSALVNAAAYHYKQRATSTAKAFQYVDSSGNEAFYVDAAGDVYRAGLKLLSTRRTGWTAWSGTATRSTIATGSATATNVAEALKALVDDLIAHGVIGA